MTELCFYKWLCSGATSAVSTLYILLAKTLSQIDCFSSNYNINCVNDLELYKLHCVDSRLTAVVRVKETYASKRCHLYDAEYLLHVCPSDIVLMDPKTEEIRQQWRYRYFVLR